jgi:hypothetical protein
MRTVAYLFDNYDRARCAVEALEQAGFSPSEINLISRYRADGRLSDDVKKGAALGAAVGVGIGMLAALAVVTFSGIGPVAAAGLITTMLTRAATGTIVGGLLGALLAYDFSKQEANFYAEAGRCGGTLAFVRTDDARAAEAEAIIQSFDPVDVVSRRKYFIDRGWSKFDPKALGYTAEQIRRERELYRQAA